MHLLKQNTAATVVVGPVLDSAGAAVTTAVVGDFRLAKEGSSAVLSGATVTHDANGYYLIALTTTNTNTVGRLAIYSNNTAQSMGTTRFMVLLPSVYDALVTNAVNTTGGLPAATGAISALAGAVSTLTAAGVRSELAVEMGRIDTTVGSRLATAGYTAPPSAVNNATAVRSELAVELGRIDVTVSSRLATASYTAPLSAAETRSAVGLASANLDTQLADLPTVAEFEARTLAAAGYASSTHWTSTRAGYLDSVLLAANSNRTVQVTGSNHVAADIHELQPAVITSAAFATGWLTAAGTAADYVTELQTAIGTATNQTAILDRIGAFTGSGVNTVLGFLKAIASKSASTPSDVGGTFSATTDSIEAIRDAMQAGTGDASQATLVQVQGTVDAIAASISGTAINVVSRVADGGDITVYAGDDMRVRSGTEISVTITDVGGAIYSRLNTIGIANLAFGASRPSQPAGAIDGTVAALSQTGAGAAQTVTIDIEITDGGQGLAYADNYVWQIVSSRAQGNEYDTYTEIEGSLAVRRRVAVPVHA